MVGLPKRSMPKIPTFAILVLLAVAKFAIIQRKPLAIPRIRKVVDEHALQLYMDNQRRLLLNESSVIKLGINYDARGAKPDSLFLQDYVDEFQMVNRWANETEKNSYLKAFADTTRSDLVHGDICETIILFNETKGMKRHVHAFQ